nr:response regulator [Spirochaetota bacterium]
MSDTKEIYLQYQIYLAEDDDGFQRLIELKLRKEGFSVKSFSDGNGLLEEIKNEENKFLVLLDYNLPDINGRNLIEKIKNIKNNSEF